MNIVIVQERFLAEEKREYHLLFEPQLHQIDVHILEDKKSLTLDTDYRKVSNSLL
jgi:hypothetical protein